MRDRMRPRCLVARASLILALEGILAATFVACGQPQAVLEHAVPAVSDAGTARKPAVTASGGVEAPTIPSARESRDESLDAGLPPGGYDPKLVPLFADFTYVTSLEHSAIWQDQRPIPGFRPLDKRPAPFPWARASRVVAYRLGYDGWGDRAVADDGKLAPSVVLPGRELSADQRERLRGLYADEPGSEMCCDDAHQPYVSFVLYEPLGVPVGELVVGSRAVAWRAHPGGWKWTADETRRGLRRLVEDLGFLSIGFQEIHEPEVRRQYWAWRQGQPPRPFPPFGIPDDKPLAQLSATDRRRVCAWNDDEHRIGGRSQRSNYSGWETFCVEGKPLVDAGVVSRCESLFPACQEPFGKVLRCMLIAQNNPAFIFADEFAPCRPIQHCLWGVQIRLQPEICRAPTPKAVP
jgi:hypothetical protein